MRFDVLIDSVLKKGTEEAYKGILSEGIYTYMSKEYGLTFDEIVDMVEDYNDDPNFWDYFISMSSEDEINSLMKDMAPDLYEKRIKRIQDEIDRDAFRGHEFEDLINL